MFLIVPHSQMVLKLIYVCISLGGNGLFIASIDHDPALSDGRLRSGDELRKVHSNRSCEFQMTVM